MDDSHPFRSMSIGRHIPEIRLFKSLTLKLQGQDHGCGQWARSQSDQYHINSLPFHFISIRPKIPEIHFEIWPWNIQGQGHGWGQKSRSHILLSIQPMDFLFVSHQSDQPFLRYGQNSVWPWNKTSEIFIENLITISNRTAPKYDQVIIMTRAIKLSCLVVIRWVVFTLSRRQANLC